MFEGFSNDNYLIKKNFFRPKVCFLKPVIAPGATAKVNFISIWGRWHQTIFDQVEMKHFGEARIEPGSSYPGSNCSNHNAMAPLALGNTLWRCLKFAQNNQRSPTSMIFCLSKKFFFESDAIWLLCCGNGVIQKIEYLHKETIKTFWTTSDRMYKFVKRENFRQNGGLGWKSSLWRQPSIIELMVLPTFKNLWRKSYMTYLYMPWPLVLQGS